jgi:hypothetical protein
MWNPGGRKAEWDEMTAVKQNAEDEEGTCGSPPQGSETS